MNPVTIQKGSVVSGLSTRPGRACSAFKLHVITPITREGASSIVGIALNGQFAGQVTSRRLDRIVPFDLTVEQGDDPGDEFDLWLVSPSPTTAYVEDVCDRPNKKLLVKMQGGLPLDTFAVDEVTLDIADEADLADFR